MQPQHPRKHAPEKQVSEKQVTEPRQDSPSPGTRPRDDATDLQGAPDDIEELTSTTSGQTLNHPIR